MSQAEGAPTGRRIEAELQRGAEPAGTFREALVRFRHVFKIYRVADTGVVALGGVDFDFGECEFLPSWGERFGTRDPEPDRRAWTGRRRHRRGGGARPRPAG